MTYPKGLEAVCQTAFESIETHNEDEDPHTAYDAARLLSILCFLAPDAIPQSLFEPQNVEYLPGFEFLGDHQR